MSDYGLAEVCAAYAVVLPDTCAILHATADSAFLDYLKNTAMGSGQFYMAPEVRRELLRYDGHYGSEGNGRRKPSSLDVLVHYLCWEAPELYLSPGELQAAHQLRRAFQSLLRTYQLDGADYQLLIYAFAAHSGEQPVAVITADKPLIRAGKAVTPRMLRGTGKEDGSWPAFAFVSPYSVLHNVHLMRRDSA